MKKIKVSTVVFVYVVLAKVLHHLPMANVRKQKPRMEPRMPMTGRIHMLGSGFCCGAVLNDRTLFCVSRSCWFRLVLVVKKA